MRADAPRAEHELDPALLPVIDQALAEAGLSARIPVPLWGLYAAHQRAAYRRQNRMVVMILIAIFDLFWFMQWQSAPELVPLSGVLRLMVATPLALAFLLLDWRDRLGRFYEPLLVAQAAACGLISAVLCVRTTSLTTLSDIRATTLVLLSTGLSLRLTPPAVLANAALCATAFIASVLLSPVIPAQERGSLVINELAIAALCWGFNVMLERRDRSLFLLRASDQIRRNEVTAQNRGLRRESETDALTGCANRRGFDRRLQAAWADSRHAGAPLGLIMMDIDHFKLFNDHYGHQSGDDCLARVAATAAAQLRADDLLARYGGEEFAVIMEDAPLAVVAAAAERIRVAVEALALPHGGLGQGAIVSLSLGAACVKPIHPAAPQSLIEEADQRLYEAKRSGRNRVAPWAETPPDGAAAGAGWHSVGSLLDRARGS